jgi:hypothetical protein
MNRCDICGQFTAWRFLKLYPIPFQPTAAYTMCSSCKFIRDARMGLKQVQSGEVEPYVFGEGNASV